MQEKMALGGNYETACLTITGMPQENTKTFLSTTPPPPKKSAFHLISTTHHQAYGLLAKSLRPTQNVDITKDICSMTDNQTRVIYLNMHVVAWQDEISI